ncbi:dienelactone hydrolase family protein [Tropicimonas isoalkanivorans]|uniref:Dienelactone hydrolase n=1 Tax=Tropicimonas isoalkanivorans TaxID=441112 RepID=A0A1I1DGD1_9RHOB|nr:dienelactone hydrolase family protein [Tropicimonas isoalkanivorans]SFB73432.1 Dienelactone hydrolase [Tropicimonas isoalkanivorans]
MQMRTAIIGPTRLEGGLVSPSDPRGLVIFAHGSGSSRFSPRNTYVAEALQARGFATLLFDLLSTSEAEDCANVFDIRLLGRRVLEAVLWAHTEPAVANLAIGLFGASTGAAAALVAAAEAPGAIAAVVSRGGRPDLAAGALHRVRAPTLLLVGGADWGVIELNESAFAQLHCEKRLTVVPGATHLFEEPGTLEAVIDHAADWFEAHLHRHGQGSLT